MKRIIAIFALLTVYATAADSSYNCTVAELTDLTGGVFEVSGRRIQKFIADPDNHEGAFIVISKADMTLTVLNTESKPLEVFPICCGAEYGDKQTVRDLRTPEGVFKVRAVDDSRLWRERYDDGTYSRPGAYGPFFIRIDYPPYHHIGIHGTNNPESIGMRDSHGCIRLNNADLTKLLPYVYENMPIIITPSLDDSEENVRFRAEGGIPDLITLK